MSKKVLVISSSLRGGSNSECLARECERGAKDAGHDVQFISLKGKELKFCIGCLRAVRRPESASSRTMPRTSWPLCITPRS